MDGEQFPVLAGFKTRHKLPLAWVKQFEVQYVKNHCGQSLARLAERGGLCWSELWSGMKGIDPFRSGSRNSIPSEEICKDEVLNAVAIWSAR